MHFTGIKCEVCSKLANTKDPIEDLPQGWLALVRRRIAFIFGSTSQEALHFCCFKCLHSWLERKGTEEQEA